MPFPRQRRGRGKARAWNGAGMEWRGPSGSSSIRSPAAGSGRWIWAVDLGGGSERAPAAASAWTAGALPGRHGPYPRSLNGAAALLVPACSLDPRAKPPGREPPPYDPPHERVRYERIRHVVRSPEAPGPMAESHVAETIRKTAPTFGFGDASNVSRIA